MITLVIAGTSFLWALWMAYISATKGTRRAIWLSWFASILLIAAEIKLLLPGALINIQLVATCLGLAMLLFDQRVNRPRLRFSLSDAFLCTWIACQFVSAGLNGKLGPASILGLILPTLPYYLLGRFFIGSLDDLAGAVKSSAPIFALCFLYMAFESVTHVNPQFQILGVRSGTEARYGLLRAHGVSYHPISMGLVLVGVLPWAWEAAWQAKAKLVPSWRRFAPWFLYGSIFTTLSRGPLLAVIIAQYVRTTIMSRKLRVPLIILALVGSIAGYVLKNEAAELIDQIGGGSRETVQIISINGKEYVYTGSYHRYLLFLVFENYLENAGLFGYGHNFDMSFLYESGLSKFESIDSTYIQIVIENGYLGASVLIFWGVACGVQLLGLARELNRPYGRFAASTTAVLVAIYAMLLTVFLSADVARVLYFTYGLTATLVNLKALEKRNPRRPAFIPQQPIPPNFHQAAV